MAISSFLGNIMICTRDVKTRSTATFVVMLAVALMNHRRVSVESSIVQGPSDKIVIGNESTYFNCSTSIKPVDDGSLVWFHFPLDGRGQRIYVYKSGRIVPEYRDRFTIETDFSSGTFNLIALRVDSKDAGKYECTDDIVDGEGFSAQLTVLAANPTCNSSVIQDGNYCGLHPDEVQLSCNVTYYGNIAPQLEWRMAGGDYPVTNTASFKSGNSITYSATLKTDLSMNNQSYVCQTRSVTSQYKCNSETIRLKYVFSDNSRVNITMDQEITCSVNTSQSCSYKWIWFSGSDSVTVSNNQTLKPSRAGSHRCEAMCLIGNKSCMVNAMFVEVSPAAPARRMLLLLLVLPVMFILIALIILCRRRKRADKGLSSPHIYMGEFEPIKPDDSMAPLVADNNEQVKQRDAEPNKDPEVKVVTYNSEQSTPFLASKVESKEPVKQNFAEPDQGLKEKVGAIETDQSKVPSTALKSEDKEEVKHNQIEPNKRTKGLGLLSGRPVRVEDIKRQFKERRIAGVTALKNNIFIAFGNSPVLEVYDAAKKCEFIREKSIPEMVNPFDLTSCQKTDCVFIIDFKFSSGSKEIIRIDSSLVVDERWSTGDDFGNLSVSSESNVIMCVPHKKKLIEYTKDGDMLREINMPGKTHPCNAIKLNDGHFVISRGWKYDPLHQVCNVTTDGDVLKLVKSFGGDMGSSLQHLNEPNCLIVDEQGSVLVLDSRNERVLLLDSNLEIDREFITDLRFPFKMCLCKAPYSLHVVVSSVKADNVLVFNIK